jgi:hypothetical protein
LSGLSEEGAECDEVVLCGVSEETRAWLCEEECWMESECWGGMEGEVEVEVEVGMGI